MTKRNIITRSIGMLIAIVIAFSFSGCQSLQEYKANAKIKLDDYISELSFLEGGKPTKNHINGPAFDKIVDDEKNSIDDVSSRKAVDKKLDDAKRAIDAIPIVFSRYSSDRAYDGETDSLGFHFIFYLKIFDENVSYECTAGAGAIHSFPRSEEPLSSIYDGFFGRHSQVVRWFIECVSLDDQGGFDILYDQDFIDFIIKIDDAIIGYIVVEMNFSNTNYYTPKLLVCVVNPKIDGEYQAMDEEERTNIETIKEIKK